MSFASDSAIVERDGTLFAEVSPRWEIWGPNGGYLAAIALRAAGLRAPPGHRPASLSCQYLKRGLFGEARLEVETLRSGRWVSCFSVRMVQGEQLTLAATIWTTNAAGGLAPDYREPAMPAVPPPEELEPPRSNPGGFTFWENFDLRIASAEARGRAEPRGALTERWLRFRGWAPGEDPFLAEARAVVLIDTMLWPAHWSRTATPLDYAAPSLDVSVWFHEPTADSDWLLIEARAPVSAAGLIYGEGRVWTRDGRLVAGGASNMLVLPASTPQ